MTHQAVRRTDKHILTAEVSGYLDQSPLSADVDRLSDPDHAPHERELMALAAKYFFAFVHPGAHANPVPPGEIVALLEMYARCKSLNEPEDDIETMNRLRRFAPALALAADTSRAGLLLHELLTQAVNGGGRYIGMDLHAGSGLMVLGQRILARRLGRRDVEVWGVESDLMAAARAGELLRELGAGNVVGANPATPEAYEVVGGRPVTLVSSAECATGVLPLGRSRFFDSFAALFATLGRAIESAVFFPEGIIAYSRDMNASLILSRENGFQRPPEFADGVFHPQGLLVEGRILPLHRLAAPVREQIR